MESGFPAMGLFMGRAKEHSGLALLLNCRPKPSPGLNWAFTSWPNTSPSEQHEDQA